MIADRIWTHDHDTASPSCLMCCGAVVAAGVVTLRAYGVQESFLARLYDDVDEANRMHYHLWMTNYWYAIQQHQHDRVPSRLVQGREGRLLAG